MTVPEKHETKEESMDEDMKPAGETKALRSKRTDFRDLKGPSASEREAIKDFIHNYDQINSAAKETLRHFHQDRARVEFQFAEALAGVRGLSSRFKTLGDEMAMVRKGYIEAVRAAIAVAPLLQQLRRNLPQIFEDPKFAREACERDAVLAAGILPHGLIPWEKLDFEVDPHCLRASICEVTTSNWEEISSILEDKLVAYEVNEESKEALREALATHQNGLHRATVRLIMPEIERMVRFHFGSERVDDTWIAKDFLTDAGELPADEIIRIERGLDMFLRLQEHIYAKLKTPELIESFKDDPIPNRHAALHGLIPYNRIENSLNAVFMFDFIMELVNVSIPYSRKHN